MRSLTAEKRAKLIRSLSPSDAYELMYRWRLWARPEQIAAGGDWLVWLISAGRGWGKTRSGAEWVTEQVWDHGAKRIALVGRTSADARDVMIEGESGILNIGHPDRRPRYEPSKRRLTWANGATATTYSAEEPRVLRGPQHDCAWADEIASWQYDRDTWDQLQFGLRLGKRPRCVVTTTPRPTPLVKELFSDRNTVITRGATKDNRANLATSFLRKIYDRYEGTRLGRQELYAELLTDNPGALWKRSTIDQLRVVKAPAFRRVIVAVDPAVSSNANSAETGIVVVALGTDGHGYVLDDRSLQGTPGEWGAAVVTAYHAHAADLVIGEQNNGGDLVAANVATAAAAFSPGTLMPYQAVHASRGKQTRAEPIAALYEQGRIHHVGGFGPLEDQMCDWDPTTNAASPDRLDALVWGFTKLMLGGAPSEARAPDISFTNYEQQSVY